MNREERIFQVATALEALYPHGGDGFVEIRAINFGQPMIGPKVLTHFLPLEDLRKYDSMASQMVGFMQGNIDGKGYNCYIGRALRQEPSVGSATNVDWVQSASIDIDPIKESPDMASSSREVDLAFKVGNSIRSKWGGSLVATGNGCQLWLSFADALVDIRGRREWWAWACREWEQSILRQFQNNESVRLDPQFDIPRIVKLPGSLSVKGRMSAERPHRWATIQTGISHLTSGEIISYASEGHDEIRKTEEAVPVPVRFFGLLRGDSKLNESWLGIRADLPSGRGSLSEQDMALVAICKKKGFTRAECEAILRAAPRGSRIKHDGYATLTVERAFQ